MPNSVDALKPVPSEESGVMPATSYSDMWKVSQPLPMTASDSSPGVSALIAKDGLPHESTLVIARSETELALRARQKNRSYNGAPPTIPHSVDTMSSKACMACHGDGLKSKSLRAAKISHTYYSNCTQCHVESKSSHAASFEFQGNSFAGMPAPSRGPRAFSGAPPQIPHSTWMRNDCLSCHGLAGPRGIQTTHPWRQNCTQCHSPSARLEQLVLPSKPSFLSPIVLEGTER